MTQTVPYIHPERPAPKFRPLKAWRHMQRLIADKEDTEQVFHIIEALNGNAARRDFDRFLSTQAGQARLAERRHLPTLLDDHDPIKALPEDTVGRAYVAFMEREGLSAAGLVAESESHRRTHQHYDDDLLWFINRLRDTHDLYHVLTGYGRDALGEAALLGYTHSQHRGRGVSFIAYMGGREIAKYAPRDARIKDVIREGRENGKLAGRIIEQDIEALLREPLAEARKRLNIRKPVLYRRAVKLFQEQDAQAELQAA